MVGLCEECGKGVVNSSIGVFASPHLFIGQNLVPAEIVKVLPLLVALLII